MEEGEGRTNVGGGELHVKRATGRKNEICVVELVHARRRGEEEGRANVCGAKNVSRIRKRKEGRRGGRGGGRGGRGREGKGRREGMRRGERGGEEEGEEGKEERRRKGRREGGSGEGRGGGRGGGEERTSTLYLLRKEGMMNRMGGGGQMLEVDR